MHYQDLRFLLHTVQWMDAYSFAHSLRKHSIEHVYQALY